jgi:glycosyltransferase involved in cell wall biosynthesis
MPMYNNAAHLPGALDSILAQSYAHFTLVLLNDGSTDATGTIAQDYAARDARIRYHGRARRGMIATWREVAEMGFRECPSAQYFAWVSDHDRWHPEWLARLSGALDTEPDTVLAYPQTRRLTPEGHEIAKPPRRFEAAIPGVRERWRHFCRHSLGAGDMVYGLMRIAALRDAGIFRTVLRPDRLLVAELALRGGIRQVPDVLWFRRNAVTASVARQRHTLVVAGEEPAWFWWPPWMQHARQLRCAYDEADLARLGVTPAQWRRMRVLYQLTYGWRHARKSETSYILGRGLDRLIRARKQLKHAALHGVYRTLMTLHDLRARVRRGL